MKCPNCATNLLMTNRSGVEIDYCPQCRGIWLDKGELDKLIDREQNEYGARPASARPVSPSAGVAPQGRRSYDDDYDDAYEYDKRKNDDPTYRQPSGYYDDDHRPYDKRHKKKSMLGEIFDIFD
jgi:uncharacterized protein